MIIGNLAHGCVESSRRLGYLMLPKLKFLLFSFVFIHFYYLFLYSFKKLSNFFLRMSSCKLTKWTFMLSVVNCQVPDHLLVGINQLFHGGAWHYYQVSL
jgi:hypothetical protein